MPAQAAIDAAGAASEASGLPATVCVRGRLTLTRAPIGSWNRFAALSTHAKNLTIRCDDAVLELVGDQGNSTTLLLSIDPGAENVRVTGCVFDSAAATNTAEQTHAIGTSGVCAGSTCRPIRNLEIDHNRFAWPKVGSERKGDCVRLLGNAAPTAEEPGTELWGARVHDNTGDCARSFAEVQRGVHDLIIDRNIITCTTCDQDVDGEATGVIGTAGRPTNIVVTNNTFTDGPGAQGDFSFSMTSADGVVFANNTTSRGAAIYRSTNVVIANNIINSLATTSGRGVIDAANLCTGLSIRGNTITRGGHLGPLIALAPHSGVTCSGAMIVDNALTQTTPAWAIVMESASDTRVDGNRITYTVPAPGFSAILARPVTAGESVTALAISDNQIRGPVTYAVRLQASPGSFGSGISLSNNTAIGPTFGLYCADNNFTAPIVSSGNSWMAGVWPSATVSAGVP